MSTERYIDAYIDKQEPLVGTTPKGVIILGDISGYSKLVAQIELEHAQGILMHLFDKIYDATGNRFIVNEIEGDAIFAYAVQNTDPSELLTVTLDQLKDYGHAFYHARQDLVAKQESGQSLCQCGACSNIGELSMKFIVHYGEFGVNRVGPFIKLVGGTVVVAHRLLKNAVPSHSYILMTQETLKYVPKELAKSFIPLTERIEHFGDVPIGYRIFDWQDEEQKHHPVSRPSSR